MQKSWKKNKENLKAARTKTPATAFRDLGCSGEVAANYGNGFSSSTIMCTHEDHMKPARAWRSFERSGIAFPQWPIFILCRRIIVDFRVWEAENTAQSFHKLRCFPKSRPLDQFFYFGPCGYVRRMALSTVDKIKIKPRRRSRCDGPHCCL